MSFSDLDLAVRLIQEHPDQLRYCPNMGKSGTWLTWDGRRWITDQSVAFEFLRTLVDDEWRKATEIEDEKERSKALRSAEGLRSNWKLTSILKCAQKLREPQEEPSAFDSDLWGLNVQNGLLDLKSGVLRPHDPRALCRKITEAHYFADAKCPKWEKFLEWAQPNKDVQLTLQTIMGYALTGLTTERALIIFHGPKGNNGKNLFCDTVYRILGDYSLQMPPQILMERPSGGIPNDIAQLSGKRYVVASETKDSHKLNEPLVKSLTGDSLITARYLYSEYFTFTPQFTFFLITNKHPVITDTDNAIWRRIKMIPWMSSIADEDVDTTLADQFWEERDGILRWMVDGCLMWVEGGCRIKWPKVIEQIIDSYRTEQDIIGMFVEENLSASGSGDMPSALAYKLYRHWCEAEGRKPVSHTKLSSDFAERGFRRIRTADGVQWQGVGLSLQGEILRVQAEANLKLVSTHP